MRWNRKSFWIIFATFLLVSFQNCSQVRFEQIQELSSKKVDLENGSVFDGKPTFYLTRPEFTCEGQPAPLAVVHFSDSGPRLTFNQNDHCGAIKDQPLDPADVDKFSFDPDFVGYRDGIYERQVTAPDLSSPVYNEAWCQSTGSGPSLSLAVKFDAQNNIASSQIHYSSGGQNGVIPAFSVTRGMNDNSAEYQTSGFHLLIDRSQPAPQKWCYFSGQLETDKVSGSWKGPVLCRMAASKLLANVQKVYPSNSNWNSYVQNTDPAKNVWNQPDTNCSSGSAWNQCIHGGDKMSVETDLKGCSSLVANDQLDSFNWTCEEGPSGAVFKTQRLKKGRGLSDLVTKDGWKSNSIQITQNGQVRFESIPLPWWKNPVLSLAADVSGAITQLNVPQAVYVVDSNLTVPGLQVVEDGVSLVVQNGATLMGAASMNPNCNLSGLHFSAPDATLYPTRCLLTSEGHGFLWIEGAFDSSGSNAKANINLQNGRFIRLQNVKLQNAVGGFGLFQEVVVASVYDSVEAKGNRHGLVSRNSVGNLIGYSDFSNNTSTGLWLTAWDNDNSIVNSQASQNGITGFAFNSTRDLIMVSNQTRNNVVRGIEISGFTENANFESTVVSGDSYGIDISRSSAVAQQPNIFKNTAMMSTTVGLRVLEGAGSNKEVFDGQMFLGSTTNCSVTTEQSINNPYCPGTGLPGSEIFSLPTTSLSTFSACKLSMDGESIDCQGGKSWLRKCQLQDSLSNPLTNGSEVANLPACSMTDVLK